MTYITQKLVFTIIKKSKERRSISKVFDLLHFFFTSRKIPIVFNTGPIHAA